MFCFQLKCTFLVSCPHVRQLVNSFVCMNSLNCFKEINLVIHFDEGS